jgi:hypothetical protein
MPFFNPQMVSILASGMLFALSRPSSGLTQMEPIGIVKVLLFS